MTPEQVERYARHLVLREIGGSGQNALRTARIAIVGAGGLGGPAGLYLAAAGVGQITIIDDDAVSLSNLQRQIQFDTNMVGHSKVARFAERLKALNPDVRVDPVSTRLDADNAQACLAEHDLILDGTDRFATRFTINAAAHTLETALISGAVGRFDAQVGLFARPGPCYRCLVPERPPQEDTCDAVGVVGALTGVAGSMMAMEAIKWITGAGQTLAGRLWIYDGLTAQSRTVDLPRDPDCPTCGAG